MSRILIALLAMTAVAHAQGAEPTPDVAPMPAEDSAPVEDGAPAEDAVPAPVQDVDVPTLVTNPAVPAATKEPALDLDRSSGPTMGDQAIGALLGAAVGGRTTPGGLRVGGSYLYKLADYIGGNEDWFDGTAAFTYGSGEPDCFRDRMGDVICEHGLADGYAVEISANVRRYFGGSGDFLPFARAGLGVAVVRFADDGITGVAFPLHLGGGLRVLVSDGVAIVGQAELDLGLGIFGSGPGLEPQLGLNVSAGAEFRL